jgi:hypothetical protein
MKRMALLEKPKEKRKRGRRETEENDREGF